MFYRFMACAALAVGLLATGRADAALITRAFSFEATFAAGESPRLPANPMQFSLQVTYDDSVLTGSADPQTPPIVLSSNFPVLDTEYYYLPGTDTLGLYVYSSFGYAVANGNSISSTPVFSLDFTVSFDNTYDFLLPTSLVINEIPVPLPASIALFAVGLVGLGVVRGGMNGLSGRRLRG